MLKARSEALEKNLNRDLVTPAALRSHRTVAIRLDSYRAEVYAVTSAQPLSFIMKTQRLGIEQHAVCAIATSAVDSLVSEVTIHPTPRRFAKSFLTKRTFVTLIKSLNAQNQQLQVEPQGE